MTVKDVLESVGVFMVVAICYLSVGTLLSAGYIFLAGWNPAHFVTAIPVAPIIMAVFSFLVLLVHASWSVFNKTARLFSVGVCAFFFLPVILHVVSLLLSMIGLPSAAVWIFANRYASVSFVLLVAIGGMGLWTGFACVLIRFGLVSTQPPGPDSLSGGLARQ